MKEIENIKEIFKLLGEWYKYPKYQLERRVDIFFALYLKEILKEKLKIEIDNEDIFPEFPLKKWENDYSSNNADYAVFCKEEGKIKLYLIELKTDMNSIKPKQIEYYQKAKEDKKFSGILEGIIEIQKKSRQGKKYTDLLTKIEKYGVIEKEGKNDGKVRKEKIEEEIEIVYIVPENDENRIKEKYENTVDTVITFEKIIEILRNKTNDVIAQELSNLLEKIIKTDKSKK